MQTKYKILPILFLMCAGFISAQKNTVIATIKKEVDRSMENLKIDKLKPPFFINYDVVDINYMNISATMGSIVYSNTNRSRFGIPTLLVGDYGRNSMNFGNMNSYGRNIALEDEGLGVAIWSDMDRLYKSAAENYEAKVAAVAQQNIEKEELELPDFEKTTPAIFTREAAKINLDKNYWENYAKTASAILKKYPEILQSSVNVSIRDVMLYTCNSEGTEITIPVPFYQVMLNISTITDDGQELSRDLYIEHPDFEQMPALQTFIDTCEIFVRRLIKLREAPIIKEAYAGPVLFEGQAVPEIFQSLVVSNLIASRKPLVGGGGNSREMMKDKKLISRSLSVKSLSGSETYKGKKLDAYYPIDAEGIVPDKELTLIENGVLKNMFNGRTPTKKFPKSNGHKRVSIRNLNPQIMPGSVLLTSSNTSSDMKSKLLSAAKEEDLDYAYIVRGYRYAPFEIYKVYVSDGREEPVRGAVLQDFNIKSFKRILGTSDREMIYNTSAFGNITTYIVPDAILFEELDIMRDNNITLKTPFIVPQPK